MKHKPTLHRRKYWLLVHCGTYYYEAFTEAGSSAIKFHGLYKYKRYKDLAGRSLATSNTGILAQSDPYARTCWLEMALLHPGLKRVRGL